MQSNAEKIYRGVWGTKISKVRVIASHISMWIILLIGHVFTTTLVEDGSFSLDYFGEEQAGIVR